MLGKKNTSLILTVLCLLSIIWIGCSDDTIVQYVENTNLDQATDIDLYFPLQEGYITVYNLSYQTGSDEQVTFRAGRTVNIEGANTVEWIGFGNNSVDTGYFFASSSSLYYYRKLTSTPEKILELPLTNGNTWASNDINSNDFTDIITGFNDKGSDTTGSGNKKTFPTISAINFTVEQIEQLQLNTGHYYSSALRISTPNGTCMNYYWYVQGIGLVRYVIGASELSYPDGEIVGELIDYGFAN